MALTNKLKAEAKALGIPYYWSYGKKNLEELVAAKSPKTATVKPKATKPPVKVVSSKSSVQSKSKDNKAEIFIHIAKCNLLIGAERKLIKGPKSTQHYAMLDRSLTSLRDVTRYLAKIQ